MQLRKSAVIIGFYLCFSLFLSAQSKNDSLLKVWKNTAVPDTQRLQALDKLVWDYLYSKPDSAKLLAQQMIDSSTRFKNLLWQANGFSELANYYFNNSSYPEALKNYGNSLKILEQLNNKKKMGAIYGNMGLAYKMMGNYPEALKNELLSLKMAEELNNKRSMGICYGSIGNIYYAESKNDEALKYFNMELDIAKERQDKPSLEISYSNIGNIYLAKADYTNALKCYTQTIALAEETGNKRSMSYAYGNIGNIYVKQDNFNEALKNYSICLNISRELDDKESVATAYENIGYILTRQKRYNDAKKYLDSSLTLSKEIGSKDVTSEAYLNYVALDSLTGNPKKTYSDFKSYILYRDSMSNEENTKKQVTEQMNYEFDKKEAAAKAEQDKIDAIHNEQVKKQSIVIYSISAGLLLVLLLAITIFRSLQQNRKKTKIISEQKAEVEKKNVLIEQQKAMVEEKNKDILDSITYAKRLQDAILPPMSVIKKYLPDSFLLYKPKDIVAGDFYWMEIAPLNPPERGISQGTEPSFGGQGGRIILIAACDCTGHGVPGAMVSVVCSGALNRALKEFQIRDTGKILDKVRELVLETFEKSEGEVKDGMDCSFCAINTNTNEIEWSGAYNPLWYIKDGNMTELVADKQPIGKHDKPVPFNTTRLKLNKGDSLYLFTDGYADQFGGPKGKKFKYKQLQQLIMDNAQLTMEEQKQMLEKAFEEWKGDLEQVDDILVIGIRV